MKFPNRELNNFTWGVVWLSIYLFYGVKSFHFFLEDKSIKLRTFDIVEIEMKIYQDNVFVENEFISFSLGRDSSNIFDLDNPIYADDDFKRYFENELNGVVRINTQVLIITVHVLICLGFWKEKGSNNILKKPNGALFGEKPLIDGYCQIPCLLSFNNISLIINFGNFSCI